MSTDHQSGSSLAPGGVMPPRVLGPRDDEMPGFFPAPPEWWAPTRGAIAKPWPEQSAMMDLRYWSDVEHTVDGKRPSVRDLANEWGWRKTRVHDLVKSTEKWADTFRTPTGQTPDTDRTLDQGSKPAISSNPDTFRTPTGQTPDTDRTGGSNCDGEPLLFEAPHSTQTQTQTQEQHPPSPLKGGEPSGAEDLSAWDEACRLWVDEVGPAVGRALRRPRKSTKDGKKMIAALKSDPSTILNAMRFLAHGENDWYRDQSSNGGARSVCLESLLRHREKYAGWWLEEQQAPPSSAAPPRRKLFEPSTERPILKPPPRRPAGK